MVDAAKPREHVASIEIAAPVETVWNEITKTGRVQKAVYNSILESTLQPGARLRYYSPDRKRVFVVGEVLEIEPPRRLVHTYLFTMQPEPATTVEWRLDPTEEGCRVTITHSGWTDAHTIGEKTGAGWQEILGLLKAEIETGTLPLKTRIMYRLMGAMSFMLPKTTKASWADEQGW